MDMSVGKWILYPMSRSFEKPLRSSITEFGKRDSISLLSNNNNSISSKQEPSILTLGI
jgi:hypothetical protein